MIEFPLFSTPMLCRTVKGMSAFFIWFSLFFRKINSKRTSAKRVEENDVHEDIPPQVEQVEQVSQVSH